MRRHVIEHNLGEAYANITACKWLFIPKDHKSLELGKKVWSITSTKRLTFVVIEKKRCPSNMSEIVISPNSIYCANRQCIVVRCNRQCT